MLPFDNKSEFQVIVDMPEGTTLEQTARVAREIAAAVRAEPEVTDYQIYVGTAAPYNFNGLVRHYFLRRGPNVADIQVNLLPKHDARAEPRHRQARPAQGRRRSRREYGARIKVAEVPPGPPVLQTWWRRSTGQTDRDKSDGRAGARDLQADRRRRGRGLVRRGRPAEGRASSTRRRPRCTASPRTTVARRVADRLERRERRPAASAPTRRRTSDHRAAAARWRQRVAVINDLLAVARGKRVPLGRAGESAARRVGDKSIYHKNLMPVVYVTGDVAGAEESPVYAILKLNKQIAKLGLGDSDSTHQPFHDREAVDEVGRRMAHHLRGVPRSRRGVRGRADPDLRAGGRLVPVVQDAAHHHGGDPVLAGRHPAGALGDGRVLHGDLDDRFHRRAPVSWCATRSSSWISSSCG